ncbi:MAG: HU family DNA-binding protein [Acidobacteria bacterium]|nr:HU family DNA-binding protein [Acidobacteriota bacterium]
MAGKSDIVDSVADAAGLTKKQAGDAVNAVFEAITGYLGNGDRVQIPGFGSFSVSERAARTGVNPATGKQMQIPASKNVRLKPGKDLKEAVNG